MCGSSCILAKMGNDPKLPIIFLRPQWWQIVGHLGPPPDLREDTGEGESARRFFEKEKERRNGLDGGRRQKRQILNAGKMMEKGEVKIDEHTSQKSQGGTHGEMLFGTRKVESTRKSTVRIVCERLTRHHVDLCSSVEFFLKVASIHRKYNNQCVFLKIVSNLGIVL